MIDTKNATQIQVVVTIRSNPLGQVWSDHDLASDVDRTQALSWPTRGQEQVANSLFVEAMRREAVYRLLLRASKDGDYLQRLTSLTKEEQNAEMESIAQEIRTKINLQLEDVPFAALWDAFLEITR